MAEPRSPSPLIRWLARWLLRGFFRKVEVEGLEQVPSGRPLVFIANHINGLVDPALLLAFLPSPPRFLAKSTLWANPVVRPLAELAAAIPVYRRQDAGVDPAKNAETFIRCHEVLAEGGSIALFPEGRSHNEPALVPLKTGVSRIVLEAEAKLGPLGVQLVPVGLTFDDKSRFRSRVLVRIGTAIDPAAEIERYRSEPEAAVRALTERVRTALAEVTLNYPSWQEARLIERAAEIFERPSSELPAPPSLGRRFSLHQAFLEGYAALKERESERVAQVAQAVAEYDAQLELYQLRDVQVASSYPSIGVLRFVAKSLWRLLVRLPLALIGTVLSWPPYQLVRVIAHRWGHTADQLATYKVLGSLVLYPLFWLAEAGVAALIAGWQAGLGMLVLAPASALVALKFHERGGHLRREARAYLFLRSEKLTIVELRRLRVEVLAAVQELAKVYREG